MPAPTPGPRHPEVGVIGLCPVPWGGPWLTREHVLTRLGREFHVVWLDPAREWRAAFRGAPRPSLPAPDRFPGFSVYRPGPLLPKLYRPTALALLTDRLRLRAARRRLERLGARRIVLYLWRPEFATALDLVAHDASCYHIDDEYTFSATEQPQSQSESAVIRRVDDVFIISPALMAKKGHLNPHTLLVPEGVDYQRFVTPMPEPADLAPIPHPRVGYVGLMKEQMDLGLLVELARARPRWSFVLVGPSRLTAKDVPRFAELTALPNVHHLGGKPVEDLPAYVQHLDVGTMPYVFNDYTKFIFPLKLHEYLAGGIPAVGTPIRSLQDFAAVIRLARTAEEWLAALEQALHPLEKLPERVAARRAVAREYDWKTLVGRIAGAISARLETKAR